MSTPAAPDDSCLILPLLRRLFLRKLDSLLFTFLEGSGVGAVVTSDVVAPLCVGHGSTSSDMELAKMETVVLLSELVVVLLILDDDDIDDSRGGLVGQSFFVRQVERAGDDGGVLLLVFFFFFCEIILGRVRSMWRNCAGGS